MNDESRNSICYYMLDWTRQNLLNFPWEIFTVKTFLTCLNRISIDSNATVPYFLSQLSYFPTAHDWIFLDGMYCSS